MRFQLLAVPVMAVVACSQTVAVRPDGPPACTKALYDPCLDEHNCTSMKCQTFTSPDLEVCSQTCSATMPCPDQNGSAVPCNAAGLCQPPVANSCVITP